MTTDTIGALADTDPPSTAPEFWHLDLSSVLLLVRRATESLETTPGPYPEAELVDRMAQLESLQNSVAALQSATVHAFARVHAAARTASGTVEPEKLDRGIAAQIGLACHASPSEGRKRMRAARDVRAGLDHVRALFAHGLISAFTVRTVVTATDHLDADERAEVDRRLAEHPLERMGVGRIRSLARSLAAQVAPEKFRARTAAARAGRRVTLRPADDGMTYLTAHLPVDQGVACLAALHKAFAEASVSPEPLTRGRGQVMADTLVERLTGQATAGDVNIAVQVMVPIEALVDPACPLPAEISGHGPIPVELLTTTEGRTTWRRLVTRDGVVIGGDSTRRTFTGFLAELIRARDGHRCTEPYCDAPIREIDHVVRWADGGPTEFGNGRGLCRFHNDVREQPGWRVERTPEGIRTTTPTGHQYTRTSGDRPGGAGGASVT